MNHLYTSIKRAGELFGKKNPSNEQIETVVIPDNVGWDETVSYVPPVSGGRVIKVYDGDSITIATYVHGLPTLYRFSVRLNGIDCPEMRTRNETEKKAAVIAKELLSDKILGRYVELRNVSLEKYGRILADVMIDNESMSEMLITNHLAVRYDGGKKLPPDDWMDYYLTTNMGGSTADNCI